MGGDLRSNRNEMLNAVRAAWLLAPAVIGLDPAVVKWDFVVTNFDTDDVPNSKSDRWLRSKVQNLDSRTTSISGRRTRNEGVLTAQVFLRRDTTAADNHAQMIADFLAQELRKHRGTANLYDIGAVERPFNNGFSQADVKAKFYWEAFTPRGA